MHRTRPPARTRCAARSAARLRLDARLREIDFGRWETLAFDSIDRSAIEAWADAPWDFVPPGGESAAQMAARAGAALDEILRLDAAHVVVVAHGGPLRVMLGTLLRLPRAQWLGLRLDPGDVVTLDVGRSHQVIAPMSLQAAPGSYTRAASGVLRR